MFDYPELAERYKKLEKWDGDWVNYWTVTAGEEDAEDNEMGHEERPPTPRKISMAKQSHAGVGKGALYESEFEHAMQKAREQAEKRHGKPEKKREEENRKKAVKEEAEKLKKDQGTFLKKELEAERDRARKSEREGTSAASGALPDMVIENESTPLDNSTSIKQSVNSLLAPSHSLSPPQTRTPSRSPSPSLDAAHHFITIPGSSHERSRRRWLKVKIAGVHDEVAAHCGIFIRGQNLEYDAFVERVGALVRSWVL
jgi:hypothetical protein